MPIEKDSLAETLLEIAAKHGNAVSVGIVASYASQLTDAGRDALIRAIGECYSPTRFAEKSTSPTQPIALVELQRLQFGDSFVWDRRLWTLIDRDIETGDEDCYIAREHHYGLQCPGAHDQFCRFPTTVAVQFVNRSVPDSVNTDSPPAVLT